MKQSFTYYMAHLAMALLLATFAVSHVAAQKKKIAASSKKSDAPAVSAQDPQEEPAPVAGKKYKAKICVAMPKTNLAPAETAAESLRNSLVKYLSGPAAEIVPLDALVGVQQHAEAAEKGCGYYLAISLIQKKKGGGESLGGFLKSSAGAAPLLSDLGMGKTAQTVSTTATRSAAKLSTAGDLAVTIKAKDEVTLDYRLFNAESMNIAANGNLKAKAGKDGEDILSPMIEQSVNVVLTIVLKK